METVPQLGWWRPIIEWKQFRSWADDCPSNISSFFYGYLIYPPDNDRWKCHLKWYITAPWAPSIAFAHRCRWGSHSSEPINLCGWNLGIRYGWMLAYFFLHVRRCLPSWTRSALTVWSILPCLARYGPDARSLEACLGLRLGRLLVAYATTVIPSHKSVGVKNVPEMQIVPKPNKMFQIRIKLSPR